MVERPIKKSDRQTVTAPSDLEEISQETTSSSNNEGADSIAPSPEKRVILQPVRSQDKTKTKGRAEQQNNQQSSKSPLNPALMRGPKPTPPKVAPVIQNPSEATIDDSDKSDE